MYKKYEPLNPLEEKTVFKQGSRGWQYWIINGENQWRNKRLDHLTYNCKRVFETLQNVKVRSRTPIKCH